MNSGKSAPSAPEARFHTARVMNGLFVTLPERSAFRGEADEIGDTTDIAILNVCSWRVSRRTGGMAQTSESSQEETLRCRWVGAVHRIRSGRQQSVGACQINSWVNANSLDTFGACRTFHTDATAFTPILSDKPFGSIFDSR